VSEGLAKAPKWWARLGFEPATWTQGIELATEPPRPTVVLLALSFLESVRVAENYKKSLKHNNLKFEN